MNQEDGGGNVRVDRLVRRWQPMETAPKDGTRIIIHRLGWAEDICIAYWDENFQMWTPVNSTCEWHNPDMWKEIERP